MGRLYLLCAVAVLLPSLAHAGSATSNIAVNKIAPLRVISVGVMADCSWAPGTVVLQLNVTGGTGKPVVYSIGGTPLGDLAISGNNLVIGANGIATANCNTIENIQIVATQQ
jgi:hypothetical protein